MGITTFIQSLTAKATVVESERHVFSITKSDEDKQYVFGWASVAKRTDGTEISDFEGDVITPEELEKAAYTHVLTFRNTGERHDPDLREKGKLIESCVFTKEKQQAMGIPEGILPEAWWCGYHITDPDVWDKIKSGEYEMFSIDGKGERVEYDGYIIKEVVVKSFMDCIEKYNPYHDGKGRFADKNNGSFVKNDLNNSKKSDIIETINAPSAKGTNVFKVKNFANKQKLNNHWQNGRTHKDEYPEFTKKQYVEKALSLIQSPVSKNIKGHIDKNSNVIRYDVKSNDFVIGNPEKGVKTLFKPKAGQSYYNNQRKEDLKNGGKE